MQTNLISVIIPCYNQGAFIQDAIDCVKQQTYSHWEIIIINDGSDDKETINKLNALKEEGFNILDFTNGGVSAARNKGIAVAKGEFILPLDADDKIEKNYFAEAIKIMLKKPEVNLVYSDCEYFGTETGLSTVPPFSMEGMLSENLIFNSAIYRKSLALEIGGYDEGFLLGWEDWEFWLRLIKKNEDVYKLNATYYFYRIKIISRNSLIVNEKRSLCEQQLYKKHIDKFLMFTPRPISTFTEFNFYKNQYKQLDTYREQLHKSLSYRLGNFLLKPLKIFKNLITRNK